MPPYSIVPFVGINSQTPQTLSRFEGEVPTSNNDERVICIGRSKEGGWQPAPESVKTPVVVGGRKVATTTKDKDGYDLGASCSNQRNNDGRDLEGRRPKRK